MRTGQGRPLPLHTVKASSELMRRGTKQRVSKRESNSCGYVALIISLIAVFTLASLLFLESYFRGATTNPLVIFTKPKVNSDLNSGEHIDVNDLESPDIYEANAALDSSSVTVDAAAVAIQNPVDTGLSPLLPFNKRKGAFDIHFIHVPKCGGTSLTSILREVACLIDPTRNEDCCTNPGFCDWFAHRRCQSIRGCTNHNPQRRFIFKNMPSITILREPISRILSAWFYRGHNPNNDFFAVRPYFKEIWEGKRPPVLFDEYMEMPEYQNIQTRMFGADSFPYRNVTVNQEVYAKAVIAMNKIFFVAIQEEYDVSVEVMLRELKVDIKSKEVRRERDQQYDPFLADQKQAIRANEDLLARLKKFNYYDVELYKLAFTRFCRATIKYPDLYQRLKESSREKCNTYLSLSKS